MLKQNIKYTDPDGNDRTEDYWFQVTKPEFLRKAMAEGGQAYVDKIQSISNLTPEQMEGKGRLIMNTFEDILGDAVGKRIESEDGAIILDKSPEIRKRFMYSGAYDSFFMDLIERPDSGAVFMRSILPRDAQEEIARLEKENLVGSMADAARTIDGDVETKAAEPDPFPSNLEKAVEANRPTLTATAPVLEEPGKDESDEPKWLQEGRYPNKQELMRMDRDEMLLATKMRSNKAFG